MPPAKHMGRQLRWAEQWFGQNPSELCTPLQINLLSGTAWKVCLWLISLVTCKVLMGRQKWILMHPCFVLLFCPGCCLSCSLGQVPARWKRSKALPPAWSSRATCTLLPPAHSPGHTGPFKLLWDYTICRRKPHQSLSWQNWALSQCKRKRKHLLHFLSFGLQQIYLWQELSVQIAQCF